MPALRSFIAGAALAVALATPAAAQFMVTPQPPKQEWSFGSVFGTYDLAAAQRGFQVYSEVCSNCHAMKQLHYRDLAGIGLSTDQIKAVAAAVQVPAGLNDTGEPIDAPGTPGSQFRSPFPNEKATRAALNGALPPDLSVIVNAREGHADYVYAILNGYSVPPAGFNLMPGMNYNTYFPGHQIGMPPPLRDGQVAFADGTPNTLPQMSDDVVTFLAWAANPELVQRKQLGVRVILFLVFVTGISYVVKRKVWADVH